MNIFRIVRLRNKVLNTTCQDVWFGVKIWGTSVHKDWSYRIMALPIQSVAASILKWNNLEGSPLEEEVPKPTNLSLSSHSFQFIHTSPARAPSRYYSASRKYKSSWLEPSKHVPLEPLRLVGAVHNTLWLWGLKLRPWVSWIMLSHDQVRTWGQEEMGVFLGLAPLLCTCVF